jgi:hypothetical protein
MGRIAALLTCLAVAGCVAAAAQMPAGMGAEFTLAPGESARIEAASLSVRFVAVTEDSRCPGDTTCIWAGEVRAQLEVREGSNEPRQVELKPGDETRAGSHRVILVRVEPQPTSKARIDAQQYRATLTVDRVSPQ